MRVFFVTATSSIFAYIWLWIVLLDQEVALWEGILTAVFFVILLVLSYKADKFTEAEAYKKNPELQSGNDIPVIEYSACEIYKELLTEK